MSEELINKFDPKYRKLLISALKYLEENEASWKLSKPIDKEEYLKHIVIKANG